MRFFLVFFLLLTLSRKLEILKRSELIKLSGGRKHDGTQVRAGTTKLIRIIRRPDGSFIDRAGKVFNFDSRGLRLDQASIERSEGQ